MTGVSIQEEEDTLMIQVASNAMNVHIYIHKTRMFCCWLYEEHHFRATVLWYSWEKAKYDAVFLEPIYDDKRFPEKSGALINWHALTGCDTTGHIHGQRNKGWFAWPRRWTVRRNATWLWRVCVLSFLSRWSPHWGSKYAQVFFGSSNLEINKELTNCQRPRKHGLNICAVLMSRLIYCTRIWY